MTAAHTLATAEDQGFRLEVVGQNLRLSGSSRMATDLRHQLQLQKPEILTLLRERVGASPDAVCSESPTSAPALAEWAALVSWFGEARGADALPVSPFLLRPGVRVVEPSLFLEMLSQDVAAGPGCGRDLHGAVRGQLRDLKRLVTDDGKGRIDA